MSNFSINNLVLYKSGPARITETGDKIGLETARGKSKRVRDKDIVLLHPGPCSNITDIDEARPLVDPTEAWELLEGETTSLADLAELLFDQYTPQTAWQTWALVVDGVYFGGTPEAIRPTAKEHILQVLEKREREAQEAAAWKEFIERLQQHQLNNDDLKRLSEVERVALGLQEKSRILNELNVAQTPSAAHRFLVNCGYWTENFNPWPGRFGVSLVNPDLAVPVLNDETRRDLTELQAFAIDDEGNEDPDDAISLDGDRIWVHIADVAALVRPDSELDQAARERGSNLYLPEIIVHMLPKPVTHALGMGLSDVSPALSVGFRLDENTNISDVEVCLSRVRVTRLSYEDAESRMPPELFNSLFDYTVRYRRKRSAAGSAGINLPEVSVKVEQGQVVIRDLPVFKSRELVTDCMLMAGEAIARFALDNGISIPYAGQLPPDESLSPVKMSEMFAYRRQFKPTRVSTEPLPHAGLGLSLYTRATSPLRRYSDLLVHQQLRAFLGGIEPMDQDTVASRLGVAEENAMRARRTERQSNAHWKRVYLAQNADWQGNAVLVDQGEHKSTFLIPELALDTKLKLKTAMKLDDEITLAVRGVDLAEGSVFFRIQS